MTARRVFTWTMFCLAFGLGAAGLPPITDAEKALEKVPGAPNAPAVVLFEKGDLTMMDRSNQKLVSILNVHRRVKVLTEEGAKQYGEVVIWHSRQNRMSNLQARTVLPDGREVPVPADAVFERRTSQRRKQFETAVAFPNVVPGAILDYSYELRFDTIYYLQPWIFQAEIPTLHSEIVYHIPEAMGVGTWGMNPPGRQLEQEVIPERAGRRLRVWATDLPAVPTEPYSLPLSDFSGQFMLVPHYEVWSNQRYPLLETWGDLAEVLWEQMYGPALKSDKAAVQTAKELAAGSKRQTAEAIYAFVRDEIRTEPSYSILNVDEKSGVSGVVERRSGTPTEKALLLHAMLGAAKIDSDVVWAPDRDDGRVDLAVANPEWFERTLVRVELDGQTLYADPSSPALAFGRLRAANEGQQAIVYDRKKPETIELPRSPLADHRQLAEVDLALDAEGRVTGTGTITLTGHHAAQTMAPGAEEKEVVDGWSEWLGSRYDGYDVSDVAVKQDPNAQTVEVSFALAQREEEVLGDEATLHPSRPLGPARQLFEMPPAQRRTPVLLDFGDVKQVEVTLTWPEGWQVESGPVAFERATQAGSALYQVETDPAERTFKLTRRMEINKELYVNSQEYASLRELFELMERQDAKPLVLVRR